MIKRIFLAALALLILLALIIVGRALYYRAGPVEISQKYEIPVVDLKAATNNLSEVVKLQTIATVDGSAQHAKAFEEFHRQLEGFYPEVYSQLELKIIPPFGILLKWQGSNTTLKPMLMMAHQDVVPIAPDTEDLWEHPPFSGQIIDGVIWGRGTIDDKGNIIAILEAATNLLKQGYAPERTIYFFFGDNEEIFVGDNENLSGPTALAAVKYFEENNITLESVIDEGGLILQDFFPQVKEPVAIIGVAEKGYVSVEISVKTASGHSSSPPAQTSIGMISAAVAKLEKNQIPIRLDGLQLQFFENLGLHMGFTDRLILENLWIFKPLLTMQLVKDPKTNAAVRTTTAPTIFNAGNKENVLPAYAKATINFRVIPGETAESVVQHVKDTIDNPLIDVKTLVGQDPSPISSVDSKTYKTIEKLARSVLSEDNIIVAPTVLIAATDSKYFSEISDNIYRFSPYSLTRNELDGFHGTNERLKISNLEKMIQFYILYMKNMSQQE